MTTLNILHLYPKEMNLYGDRGNILALTRRAEWRGIDVNVIPFEPGDKLPKKVDIIFGGGGQDSGQEKIADDFKRISSDLKILIEKGTPALLVCGLYQLFGEYYQPSGGKKLKGAGIFNLHTVASRDRHIGNIVLKSKKFGEIVGYENHSGLTFLDEFEEPLGEVVSGFGNCGKTDEGIIYKNCIGTYLHGPLLPKNPKITDFLLETALKNLGEKAELKELDDKIENLAHKVATTRPR